MTFKHILVHVDDAAHNEGLVSSALKLAELHQAKLIGLHVFNFPSHATYSDEGYIESVRLQRQQYLDQATAAQTMFAALTHGTSVTSEWRCVEGHLAPTLETHARHADLVIMGSGIDTKDSERQRVLVESVLLGSGRPLLVFPQTVEALTVGQFVTVGWDGGREASRAIFDAMPILRHAQRTCVVVVDAKPSATGTESPIPSVDICHYLAHHGVNATAQYTQSRGLGVGYALLEWAKGQGSDLLVMGAYGHSRLREYLFGGATRHVLSNSPLPVLMSC